MDRASRRSHLRRQTISLEAASVAQVFLLWKVLINETRWRSNGNIVINRLIDVQYEGTKWLVL